MHMKEDAETFKTNQEGFQRQKMKTIKYVHRLPKLNPVESIMHLQKHEQTVYHITQVQFLNNDE